MSLIWNLFFFQFIFLSISGYSLFLKKKFNLEIYQSGLFVVSTGVVFLLTFENFVNIKYLKFLFYLFGIIFFFLHFKLFVKYKKYFFISSILILFLVFILNDELLKSFDNFTHWAVNSRYILDYDSIPFRISTNVFHSSYPQGLPTYQYLILFFSEYSENKILIANSFIFLFFSLYFYKSKFFLFKLIFIYFFLNIFGHGLIETLVDTIFSVIFFFLLFLILENKISKPLEVLIFCTISIFLLSLKNLWGPAIFSMLILYAFVINFYKKKKLNIIILLISLVFASNIYLKSDKNITAYSYFINTGIDYTTQIQNQELTQEKNEDINNKNILLNKIAHVVFKNIYSKDLVNDFSIPKYAINLIFNKEINYDISISLLDLLIIFLILYLLFYEKHKNHNVLIMIYFSLILFFHLFLVIFYSKYFSFTYQNTPSYDRWINILILPIFLYLTIFRLKSYKSIIALFIICLSFSTLKSISTIVPKGFYTDSDINRIIYNHRDRINKFSKKLKNETGKKIFVIDHSSLIGPSPDKYLYYIFIYTNYKNIFNLEPRIVLKKENNDKIKGSFIIHTEKELLNILKDYQYLAILDIDNNFLNQFKSFFKKKDFVNILYKIKINNNKIVLNEID